MFGGIARALTKEPSTTTESGLFECGVWSEEVLEEEDGIG
jgi:hypothetical protein